MLVPIYGARAAIKTFVQISWGDVGSKSNLNEIVSSLPNLPHHVTDLQGGIPPEVCRPPNSQHEYGNLGVGGGFGFGQISKHGRR